MASTPATLPATGLPSRHSRQLSARQADAGARRFARLRAHPNLFGTAAFYLVTLICLPDLNSVAYQLFGWDTAFSYPLLILCVIGIVAFRVSFWRDLGRAGRTYFVFFAMFLLIGTLMADTDNTDKWLKVLHLNRTLVPGFLVIGLGACAGYHIVARDNVRWSLRILFLLAMALPVFIFFGFEHGSRRTGTFGNANEAGAAACIAVVIGFAAINLERRKTLVLFGLTCIAGTFIALFSTYSRTAIVAFVLVVLAQLLISNIFRQKVVLIAVLLLAPFAGWYVADKAKSADTQHSLQQRLNQLMEVFSGNINYENTGYRLRLLVAGLEEWLESPILGNGLGSQLDIEALGSGSMPVHNTYLVVLGESGVVPFGLFMLSLLFLFVGGIRCKIPQIRTFVLGYLLLFAVTCLTSNGQLAAREHNLMLGLCFGMIAATYTYGRRQPRSPSSRAVNGASPANLASPTAPRAARPLVRRPARLAAGS